jgi:hypothetical protein
MPEFSPVISAAHHLLAWRRQIQTARDPSDPNLQRMVSYLLLATTIALTPTAARPVSFAATVRLLVDVPGPELAAAKRVAARIYQAAGVTIVWRDERAKSHAAGEQLIVIVLPTAMAERSGPRGELGVATGTSDERSHIAYVFYDRVNTAAEEFSANIGRVLGHVIAHEIGHLLLRSEAHSATGVMHAQFDAHDFRQMAAGQLLFTKEQASELLGSCGDIDPAAE